jgi:hypothetical protein
VIPVYSTSKDADTCIHAIKEDTLAQGCPNGELGCFRGMGHGRPKQPRISGSISTDVLAASMVADIGTCMIVVEIAA